jgi:spore coat polysaccharide biosynthesis protein SpsF
VSRRLSAVLACRANGTRLYGKPLQNLAPGVTILDQIVSAIRTFDQFDSVVLAISEGTDNLVFAEHAERLGCAHVFGDPEDVLARLIAAARSVGATDVFRVTTESPFFDYSMLDRAWAGHVDGEHDITVLDNLPAGTLFEIYTLESLERSHERGSPADRSELCSNYARFHQSEFRIEILEPEQELRRPELRLTVDYPEDLIVCRAVYQALADEAPRIPLARIIDFLDQNPALRSLTEPFSVAAHTWLRQPQQT